MGCADLVGGSVHLIIILELIKNEVDESSISLACRMPHVMVFDLGRDYRRAISASPLITLPAPEVSDVGGKPSVYREVVQSMVTKVT